MFVDQSNYEILEHSHTKFTIVFDARYFTMNGFTSKTRSQLKRHSHYKTQRTRREHREKEEKIETKKKVVFIGFVCMLLSMYDSKII